MEKVANGDPRRYCTQCTKTIEITPEQIESFKQKQQERLKEAIAKRQLTQHTR